ncbi:MAG: 50S ribosomal protein L11 methyltransferase [Desulfovibrionaceae bacterium]|nr:50S ribosomal protein L11 methyltransferase [Desulfovibrionaceae bacterium]
MLHKLTLDCPDEAYDIVTGLLSLSDASWQEEVFPDGTNRFTLYGKQEDLRAIASRIEAHIDCTASVTEEPEQDWQKAWRDSIKPRTIACFRIVPPWLTDEKEGQSIVIEPKNAFGTGEHPTTGLCLALLAEASKELPLQGPFLDLGCGSGILSIACAQLGYMGLALDTDPDAVTNTQENCARNSCLERITIACRSIEPGDRAGILLANILAEPLKSLAPHLASSLTKDGLLILSGFLTLQAQGVAQAYRDLGLFVSEPYTAGEWAALLVSPKEALVRETLSIDHLAYGHNG